MTTGPESASRRPASRRSANGTDVWLRVGRGCARLGRARAGPEQAALVQQLGELHRVQGRALTQVVPDDPQVERALSRGIATDAPDEDVVLAGHVNGQRILARAGIVAHLHAG